MEPYCCGLGRLWILKSSSVQSIPALANGRLSGPAVLPNGHQLAGLPRPETGLAAHPSVRNGGPAAGPSSQDGSSASDPAVSQPGDPAG